MLNKNKLEIILLALTFFLYKSINYYTSDDALHTNHTMQDELRELSG